MKCTLREGGRWYGDYQFPKKRDGKTVGVEGPSLFVANHLLNLILKPVDPAKRASVRCKEFAGVSTKCTSPFRRCLSTKSSRGVPLLYGRVWRKEGSRITHGRNFLIRALFFSLQ